MTFKEAYDIAVPMKKRKEEKYNKWVAFVVRPLSVLCTLPFINRRVKPTTITAWSIICSLLGFCILALSNSMSLKIIGWFGFFLWAVLDGVDGNLARCTNQCSKLGDLWDTMGGYAAMVLIYYSAGIIAFKDVNFVYLFSNYLYLIIGSLTAIFSIFPRLVLHKKRSSEASSESVKELVDTSNFSAIKRFAGNITSPSGILQVFFLVSVLTHFVNIFICIYFVINLGIMVLSLRGLLRE